MVKVEGVPVMTNTDIVVKNVSANVNSAPSAEMALAA